MRPAIRLLALSAMLAASPASAAELTLNDLPTILFKLRGCEEIKGMPFGGTCKVAKEDLWASVGSDGELTLFKRRSYGDTIYARGVNVRALLADFAAKINKERDDQKRTLEALAPYLESQ